MHYSLDLVTFRVICVEWDFVELCVQLVLLKLKKNKNK